MVPFKGNLMMSNNIIAVFCSPLVFIDSSLYRGMRTKSAISVHLVLGSHNGTMRA